ncbi:hypothetical protein F4778DRAFT_498501 [Xylariomycetidae sp. FL2044]|nr:hypothetical protein F4778DRAFT_498501 [Xylariomycetidae sp. FL2044]
MFTMDEEEEETLAAAAAAAQPPSSAAATKLKVVSAKVPRQKNCNSCVQAKRRCDRRMPCCTRCAQKSIPCIYSKSKKATGTEPSYCLLSNSSSSNVHESRFPPSSTFAAPDIGGMPVDVDVDVDVHFGGAEFAAPPPPPPLDILSGGDGGDDFHVDSFIDMLGNGGGDGGGGGGTFDDVDDDNTAWPISTADDDPSQSLESESALADEGIMTAYQKATAIFGCHTIEPWKFYDPKTPHNYIASRVKAFPADIATTSSTAFMHRYLYRDRAPPCILTCFSTAVAYVHARQQASSSASPASSSSFSSQLLPMALRTLDAAAHELVGVGDSDNAGMVAMMTMRMMTPLEKLARAQALFVYQVIRLFDGDVGLRVQAERDMALFQTWLAELCKIRDNLSSGGGEENVDDDDEQAQRQLHSGGAVAAAAARARARILPVVQWERWIFAESVRRTILMAYSVITMYEIMSDTGQHGQGINQASPWVYIHRWTLGRSLWEADSAYEFWRAWRERRHFVISNYAFEEFLEHGRGEDVDEFGKILLSVYMGVDEMKEFVSKGTRA